MTACSSAQSYKLHFIKIIPEWLENLSFQLNCLLVSNNRLDNSFLGQLVILHDLHKTGLLPEHDHKEISPFWLDSRYYMAGQLLVQVNSQAKQH